MAWRLSLGAVKRRLSREVQCGGGRCSSYLYRADPSKMQKICYSGAGFNGRQCQPSRVRKRFFQHSNFMRSCWAWGMTAAALSLSFYSVAVASSHISCDAAAMPPLQSSDGSSPSSAALSLQSSSSTSSNDKEIKRGSGGDNKSPKEGGADSMGSSCSSTPRKHLITSIRSYQGHRSYMEDAYVMSDDGLFVAVFDGHGGDSVSEYLRQNFIQKVEARAPTDDQSNMEALKEAMIELDKEVLEVEHWKFQGSTALAVMVNLKPEGGGSIITANVGDCRAVLSRRGHAIDLTDDHKPNNPREIKRIRALGGDVSWFGFHDADGAPIEGTGVYRINGNLAVARSIGDLTERPYVTAEADIGSFPIDKKGDQFIIIATDGLWDVFTSEEAVQFVHTLMGGALGALGQAGSAKRKAKNRGGTTRGVAPQVTLHDWTQKYSNDRGLIRAAFLSRRKRMAR